MSTEEEWTARLERARALRRQARYDAALTALGPVPRTLPGSARLAFAVRWEHVLLLRQSFREQQARAELDLLYEAARRHGRDAAPLRAALLDPGAALPAGLADVPPDLLPAVVRRLVREERLAEADTCLHRAARLPDPVERYRAEWNLAAAELVLARSRTRPPTALAAEALPNLLEADQASRDEPDLLVQVLLTLVRVRLAARDVAAADRDLRAVEAALVELADRQDTAIGRILARAGGSDVLDARVSVAAARVDGDEQLAAAGVVVAIEHARGRLLVDAIDPVAMSLPDPTDHAAAYRWLRVLASTLDTGQRIWALHAGPDDLHVAIIGPATLELIDLPCRRTSLHEAIRAWRSCWAGQERLVETMESGEFAACRERVAKHLGVRPLAAAVADDGVERIAVIAGGLLSELPLALLPWTDARGATIMGRRFALSDLPCLSLRDPLRRRTRSGHGRGTLLLRPGSDGATPSGPDRLVVQGARATPAALHRHAPGRRLVRIDGDGRFSADGRPATAIDLGGTQPLTPDLLGRTDLTACATLVLGACETGLAVRIGRDERVGFVRHGIAAGAAAVLASRWEVPDIPTDRLLARFEDLLARHPRDVALQLAQRAEDEARWGPAGASDPTEIGRAVWWAGWTLYGDCGAAR